MLSRIKGFLTKFLWYREHVRSLESVVKHQKGLLEVEVVNALSELEKLDQGVFYYIFVKGQPEQAELFGEFLKEVEKKSRWTLPNIIVCSEPINKVPKDVIKKALKEKKR